MQQVRIIMIPGIVAILIFFSIEFYNDFSEGQVPAPATTAVTFNGYSEGINTMKFDTQGRIDYTLQAVSQITYKDDITELVKPYIQFYREGETHWNITADSGKLSTSSNINGDIDKIDLIGGVEVFQVNERGFRTVLATDFLTIDPVLEMLNTDLEVTMVSDDLEQSAIGMQADLNSDEYIFLSQTRGRYANQSN